MTQPTPPANPGTAPAPTPNPVPTPPPAPAPQPQPTPTAQAPAPSHGPTPTQPGTGQGQHGQQPGTGEDLPYYQEGVPWRNLPPDQQLAYWMHRSRKHEDRNNAMRDYDQLKADQAAYQQLLSTTQTERERDISNARRQGETEAMARANVMLVEAYVRSAAAARGVDDEAVTDLIDTLDLSKFVANGVVDTARVYRQVNRLSGNAGQQTQTGVPAAPAMPMHPQVQQPPAVPAAPAGWPQQYPPTYNGSVPPQQQPVPGQPAAAPQWYGQQPGVPAAPQWPGHQPAAPQVPGQPGVPAGGGPDFGQGVFTQAPPSGLEAGKAAARARFGDRVVSAQKNSQG
jgi:hypothetical protein